MIVARVPLASNKVPGTRIEWSGLDGWLRSVHRINVGPMRFSTPNYRRAAALMKSLTPAHVAACADPGVLASFETFMRDARYGSGLWLDPTRSLSRARIGEFITAAEGRRRQILAGSDTREKGPRLDPSRLPTDRLQGLIQSHKDMALVERLREELQRRQEFQKRNPT